MRAVRFDRYGHEDVLAVRDVPDPAPAPDRVIVRVRAAAINPGEILIREGAMHERWPATFPSGEGADFAGLVASVGNGVSGMSVGDEVLGWSDERASHAELLSVPVGQVTPKPKSLPWDTAGSMYVAPMAGYAGFLAVAPAAGETVVVSGAASVAGFTASQLSRRAGARVIGLASPANHGWLREYGIESTAYGEGQTDRIRALAADGVDGLIDCRLGGYLDMGVALGVDPARMYTIIDFAAAARLGVRSQGSEQILTLAHLAELAELAASGNLVVPIAATYRLDEVQDAYRKLAAGHPRGKIVLHPNYP